MGYRGKVREQEEARRLRAAGHTLAEIADRLGVHRCSVSRWVRDVEFVPSTGRYGPHRRPHPWYGSKDQQIEELNREGVERLGELDEAAFFAAGIALYAGEGSKGDGKVNFANSDPTMVRFFYRTELSPIPASAATSTSSGACTSTIRVLGPIAGSWDSCAPYYPRPAIPG